MLNFDPTVPPPQVSDAAPSKPAASPEAEILDEEMMARIDTIVNEARMAEVADAILTLYSVNEADWLRGRAKAFEELAEDEHPLVDFAFSNLFKVKQ